VAAKGFCSAFRYNTSNFYFSKSLFSSNPTSTYTVIPFYQSHFHWHYDNTTYIGLVNKHCGMTIQLVLSVICRRNVCTRSVADEMSVDELSWNPLRITWFNTCLIGRWLKCWLSNSTEHLFHHLAFSYSHFHDLDLKENISFSKSSSYGCILERCYLVWFH